MLLMLAIWSTSQYHSHIVGEFTPPHETDRMRAALYDTYGRSGGGSHCHTTNRMIRICTAVAVVEGNC